MVKKVGVQQGLPRWIDVPPLSCFGLEVLFFMVMASYQECNNSNIYLEWLFLRKEDLLVAEKWVETLAPF